MSHTSHWHMYTSHFPCQRHRAIQEQYKYYCTGSRREAVSLTLRPGTPWTGSWVGPRTRREVLKARKVSWDYWHCNIWQQSPCRSRHLVTVNQRQQPCNDTVQAALCSTSKRALLFGRSTIFVRLKTAVNINRIYPYPVRTAQYFHSVIKTIQLMLYRKIISVCFEIPPCGRNVEGLVAAAVGVMKWPVGKPTAGFVQSKLLQAKIQIICRHFTGCSVQNTWLVPSFRLLPSAYVETKRSKYIWGSYLYVPYVPLILYMVLISTNSAQNIYFILII